MKVACPGVIAESLPGVKNIVFCRARQYREGRESSKPVLIIRQHSYDLRLLQHDFRNEDGVGIAGPPPGKVAAMAVIPFHEGTPEYRNVFLGDVDLQQTLNIQRRTFNVQFELSVGR